MTKRRPRLAAAHVAAGSALLQLPRRAGEAAEAFAAALRLQPGLSSAVRRRRPVSPASRASSSSTALTPDSLRLTTFAQVRGLAHAAEAARCDACSATRAGVGGGGAPRTPFPVRVPPPSPPRSRRSDGSRVSWPDAPLSSPPDAAHTNAFKPAVAPPRRAHRQDPHPPPPGSPAAAAAADRAAAEAAAGAAAGARAAAAAAKAAADVAFRSGDFAAAADGYTLALCASQPHHARASCSSSSSGSSSSSSSHVSDESCHAAAVLLSNRSACHAKLGAWAQAADDADSAMELRPGWGRAAGRAAAARLGRGDAEGAYTLAAAFLAKSSSSASAAQNTADVVNARDEALAALCSGRSGALRARAARFELPRHAARPSHAVRVFVTSDIHVDTNGNLEWVKRVSGA